MLSSPAEARIDAIEPTSVPKSRHPLGFSSAGVFSLGLIVQVLGFVGSVILYKFVGVSAQGQALLGTVQLFLLIASSISSVGDLRMGSAYTYFIARGKSPLDGTSTYLLLRVGIAAAACTIILILTTVNIGNWPFTNAGSLLYLLAAFLTLPLLWSVEAVFTQMFVAQGDSIRAQLPSLVEVLVRTPLLLVVAIWSPTIWAIALAYIGAGLVAALCCLPAILPKLGGFRRTEATLMVRFAWPLMGSLALTFIVTNSMSFVVAAVTGVRELNIFNAANGFRLVLLSLATAVATPLFPLVSGLHHRHAIQEIRTHVQRVLRFSAMLIVPASVIVAVFSSDLLQVFTTPEYLSGTDAMFVLAISVIPASYSALIFTALVAIGRQRLELYIAGAQTFTLFVTMYLLLPPIAIVPTGSVLLSASISILVSSLVGLAANLYYLRLVMATATSPRSALWTVICSVLGVGIGWWMDSFLTASPLLRVIVGSFSGLAISFLLLDGVGEITREDVRLVTASLRFSAPTGARLARLCWRESHEEAPPASSRLRN